MDEFKYGPYMRDPNDEYLMQNKLDQAREMREEHEARSER